MLNSFKHNELTAWSRDPLEKPTVALVQKFPVFYGT
jgi:hypothetical protein